jgi:hypothetical protein
MDKQLIRDIIKQANLFEKSARVISSKYIEDEIRKSAVHLARVITDTSHSLNELIASFAYQVKRAPGIDWVEDGGELYAKRKIPIAQPEERKYEEPLITEMVEIKG